MQARELVAGEQLISCWVTLPYPNVTGGSDSLSGLLRLVERLSLSMFVLYAIEYGVAKSAACRKK